MRDDLDFATETATSADLDIFDTGFGDGPPPEAEVGRQPFPAGDHLHLSIASVEARTAKTGNIAAHFGVKLMTGLDGTPAGRQEYIDVYLGVSKTKRNKTTGEDEPRTKEEYEKAVKRVHDDWERLVYVLGFTTKKPADKTEAGIGAWLQQAVGAEFVAALRIDKSGTQLRNTLAPRSMRKLDEPAKDAKGNATGKTALQVAQEFAANYGKRTAKRGLTARDLGKRSEFD